MDHLIEQVERARRKMIRNALAVRLGWWLFGALVVATVAIAVPKVVAVEGLPASWAVWWLVGAGVVALAGAGVSTYLYASDRLAAAREIDTRFKLRERVASSLSLPESEHGTEIGHALINDAARSVERIDVSSEFPLRVGRPAWLPIIPAVVAFALMTLVGDREPAEAKAQPPQVATAEQVKKSTEELKKKLAEKLKEAEKDEDLKEAAKALREVKDGVDELTKRDGSDRKDTTVKLNDLAEKIAERKKQLGGTKALEKELNKLGDLGKGPAEKAADAMRQGDWKKALEELDRMKKNLAEGKMSAEDLKKLAEQMGKMKERLEKAAEQHKQKMEDLKKQIEQQKQQGNKAEAKKLEQKLQQMQQQQQQMDKMQGLAQKMGQAQKAMQQGDQQAAAEAMDQMSQELEQMQQEMEEMEMLEGAMDQIEQAKMAMGCEGCGGEGCQMCQGGGMGQGQGEGQGEGQGMGRGQGSGPRADKENPTNMRDSRVRQNVGAGSSVYGGEVTGPNIKGDVRESLKEALNAEDVAPAEALDEQRLPRNRREHAREYFEKLREEL